MNRMDARSPQVVFLYSSVGAGHRAAAKALQEGLRKVAPDLHTQCHDALDFTNALFRLHYGGGYNMLVTHLPRTYGLGYRLNDLPDGPRRTPAERLRLWGERTAQKRLQKWLLEQRPALVFHTHFLSLPVVTRLIQDGISGLRQMAVVTDHHMHRFWCSEHVDRYFVPDDFAVERLSRFGQARENIEVTGIPVHPQWHEPVDRLKVLAEWNLPADKPVVLLSGGVLFTIGKISLLAEQLCREIPDVRIMVLAGANKQLLADVARLPYAQGDQPRLRGIGFTGRLPQLASVANLYITKAGGLTTTECLAKGLPMVLLKPVPGQETYNTRWLCEHNAAVLAPTNDAVIAEVKMLLNQPEKLAALRENAQKLSLPARQEIVTRILEAIETFPTVSH